MLKRHRDTNTCSRPEQVCNDNRRHPALATEIGNGIYRYYLCMRCFSIRRKIPNAISWQMVWGGNGRPNARAIQTASISPNENYLLVKTAVTFNKFMPKGNVSEMSELNFEGERERTISSISKQNKYSTRSPGRPDPAPNLWKQEVNSNLCDAI